MKSYIRASIFKIKFKFPRTCWLEIPRLRQESFQPSWLERWRIERRLREAVKEMFILGVSTRKVGDVLEALSGARVSASMASNLAKAE